MKKEGIQTRKRKPKNPNSLGSMQVLAGPSGNLIRHNPGKIHTVLIKFEFNEINSIKLYFVVKNHSK